MGRFHCCALAALIFVFAVPSLSGQVPAAGEAARSWGFNCEIPHEATFYTGAIILRLSGLTTCGYNNDYSESCLGPYDNGEDYVIRLEVTSFTFLSIGLDPHGTGWTGIAIDDNCPPDGSCLAMSTNSSGTTHYTPTIPVEPGIYYIIVDTWPTPQCIPEFDVTVNEVFVDPWGVDCYLPVGFGLLSAATLPHVEGPFSMTVSGNEYTETCLGGYDNGSDLFFSFELTDTLDLNFTLDPDGVAGSGFLIDSICPTGTKCIASVTSYLGQPFGIEMLTLPPGYYYVMIDTWSSQTRLTNATFTISLAYLCGDADGSQVISISDVIYIIGYIFGGGPPPMPLRAGDADTNGIVNISDAIYLINYIFAGGPPPCS